MALETVDNVDNVGQPKKVRRQDRRRKLLSDAVMSEEWSTLHAAPLFWFEVSRDALLIELQDRLTSAEQKIQVSLTARVSSLRRSLRRLSRVKKRAQK